MGHAISYTMTSDTTRRAARYPICQQVCESGRGDQPHPRAGLRVRRPAALAALAHRDFRLIWASQFVSTLGTQVQTVALAWLVYTLTGSAAQLGGIGLARAIPTILLSLFGGTLADHVDRRRLLIISQSVLAGFSALLAIGVSTGVDSIPILYAFAMITAAASAFDSPASQAIIPQLVPRGHLAYALTINVLAQDVAAVAGPTLGGLVIGGFGTSAAFWLDAASFFVVVAALIAIRARPIPTPLPRRGWAALIDGVTFVRDRAILWQLMVIDFLATLFVSSMGLLPVFARDILRVGPHGLGLLYAAPSAGAVAGAALFAMFPLSRRPGRMVALAIGGYALTFGLFGLAHWFPLALLLLALGGGFDAVSMAMRHTVRQLATPDRFRGRVGALAEVFSAGGPRLGDFQAGLLASFIGAPGAMVAGAAACLGMVAGCRLWAPGLWSYRGEDADEPYVPTHEPAPVEVAEPSE